MHAIQNFEAATILKESHLTRICSIISMSNEELENLFANLGENKLLTLGARETC